MIRFSMRIFTNKFSTKNFGNSIRNPKFSFYLETKFWVVFCSKLGIKIDILRNKFIILIPSKDFQNFLEFDLFYKFEEYQ